MEADKTKLKSISELAFLKESLFWQILRVRQATVRMLCGMDISYWKPLVGEGSWQYGLGVHVEPCLISGK